MTYCDGELRIYFDGVQLGDAASVPGGCGRVDGQSAFRRGLRPDVADQRAV